MKFLRITVEEDLNELNSAQKRKDNFLIRTYKKATERAKKLEGDYLVLRDRLLPMPLFISRYLPLSEATLCPIEGGNFNFLINPSPNKLIHLHDNSNQLPFYLSKDLFGLRLEDTLSVEFKLGIPPYD